MWSQEDACSPVRRKGEGQQERAANSVEAPVSRCPQMAPLPPQPPELSAFPVVTAPAWSCGYSFHSRRRDGELHTDLFFLPHLSWRAGRGLLRPPSAALFFPYQVQRFCLLTERKWLLASLQQIPSWLSHLGARWEARAAGQKPATPRPWIGTARTSQGRVAGSEASGGARQRGTLTKLRGS